MNKKLKFIIAGVAIVAGLASAVSCKDYGSDIANLTDQVNSLSSKVSALESEIKAGSVITAVKTFNDGNGGIEIVLSNGQSYKIYNGSSGTSAAVWEIKDGYWYKDGVKTEYKAVGTDGTNGTNGKNGNYWQYESGWLVEYDGETGKATGKKYEIVPGGGGSTGGGVTAVWDSVKQILTINGAEGSTKPIEIELSTQLESLVFIPQVYIDGVEGFTYGNFTFSPKALQSADSKSEKQINAGGADVNVGRPIILQYHVNPANADLSFLKKDQGDNLKFVIDEKQYVERTKAHAVGLKATPKFLKNEKGILSVEVVLEGAPATGDDLSILALEITTPKGTVTSDYATPKKNDLDKLAIALPNAKLTDANVLNLESTAKDAHYRRASQGISVIDDKAWIKDQKAWTDGDDVIDNVKKTCDLSVLYTSEIDLKEYVAAHWVDDASKDVAPAELKPEDIEAYGLSWDFAVVKNYKIGKAGSETDQIYFVNLKDGVFTPKVYETTGEAAIGRTPIVRVALKYGEKVVEYAYIKVFISDKEQKPFDAEYKFDGKIKFDCKDKELKTTVKYMNVNIYNVLGLSKDAFHAMYDSVELDFVPATEPASFKNIGTVTENKNEEAEGTYTLTWKITADEIWKNAGKQVVHYVKYFNAVNPNLNAVIKLVATIDTIQKAYDVPKPDYINEYWDPAKTATRYNVAVPTKVGDDDPNNCVFVNDINASFVTWPKTDPQIGVAGVLKLDESVTKIQYFFCKKDQEAVKKIGGIAVTFSVKADGLELWANTPGKVQEKIATITNDEAADIPNSIELNKASDLAKKLLNTTELFVYIGAKGIICNDDTKEVAITFDGKDHFRADYVRPVNIEEVAADYYVDAVDYGEEHSYLSVEDLVNLYDWRTPKRYFSEYENYWGFYGPVTIEIETEDVGGVKRVKDAYCDLNGEYQPLPVTVVLEFKTAAEIQALTGNTKLTSPHGYITYKNNGTGVDNFNIFLKVKVKYGWGEIEQESKVPVKKTIEG